MDTWMARLKGRFGELIAAMSVRDRKLFVGLVLTAYLCVLGGLFWLARGALDGVESRIQTQERSLASLRGLAADEAAAATRIARINEQLETYRSQDLQSFVEKAAQKSGVSGNLQGVREKQVITEGDIEEHAYSVDLSKVTLQQLVDFLYEVEASGYPLTIRTMKTRVVTVSGVKMLNVSMEVSAYRLLAEAGTGEKAG